MSKANCWPWKPPLARSALKGSSPPLKRLIFSGFWLIAGGQTPVAAIAQQGLPRSVAEELALAGIPVAATAFFVQQVGEGRGAGPGARPLLAVNAETPMNPASTMKLITTYAALELLGPAFTWKTVAASAAPLKGDVLTGDLFLKGSGDPRLVLEDFWLFLRLIRAHGVREIRGNLVLDHSLFEASEFDPSAFDSSPEKPYNVGPDALMVNYKSVTFRFIPDTIQQRVRVAAEPPLAGMKIGKLRLSKGDCGDWKKRVGADFSRIDRISFSGSFSASCGEQSWSVSMLDHTRFVGAVFRSLWTGLGGILRGTVQDGLVAPEASVIAEHVSPSLAEIVRDINKFSNNVMARQLYLDLAAEVLKLPANPELSQGVVRKLLSDKGIAMPDLVLENGAGLSRVERASALSMGRLLLAAWASPVMPEFVSSLPLIGHDGTMRRRMKTSDSAGRGHIKTGTLADVHAMAGYMLASSGRRYVVVSFVNHANADHGQGAQDSFLQWVFDHG